VRVLVALELPNELEPPVQCLEEHEIVRSDLLSKLSDDRVLVGLAHAKT
jgi:hypothetical protein